ncbi:hypothetical protein [Aquibacillus rhizosphaerae]|uniref:Protein PsiE n=1 Tax=Aquibacillus rhizosphaerae TaxID=3051431 RepID=A0ABT7LAH7_9BACI|nr:hypothetical protein [Aquibacillus sp. LR5S19]MDL4842852.1 hypothetical protein [Aquibacillus sp. LR5S19]
MLCFMFIYEKVKEKKPDPLYEKVIAAMGLSLILTILLLICIFIITGSTSLTNSIFNLNVDIKDIIKIALLTVVYAYTLDSFFEIIVKYIFGIGLISKVILNIARFFSLLFIGQMVAISTNSNLIFSISITIIFILLDALNHLIDTKQKEKNINT